MFYIASLQNLGYYYIQTTAKFSDTYSITTVISLMGTSVYTIFRVGIWSNKLHFCFPVTTLRRLKIKICSKYLAFYSFLKTTVDYDNLMIF